MASLPQAALLAAFLAGLLGGLHCVAMCSGWLAIVAREGATPAMVPLQPARLLAWREVAAHAGRMTMYAVLGGALGAAGGAAFALALGPVQQGLFVAANVLLLVLAVSLARGAPALAWLERIGLAAFSRIAPVVRPLAAGKGMVARFGLGMVWGLTPCALVYGILPVAMLAGGALEGALVMLAFGIGTLPNLLAAGWLLRRGQRRLPSRTARFAAAALVAAFALAGITRALWFPETLGAGPFCLVR
jgi:sulfite exporter TauE/SafE